MDILAAICVRQDHEYLENCLNHLIANDVHYAIIDNGMEERSLELLRLPKYRRYLERLCNLPFNGSFELYAHLEMKEKIFDSVDAGWVMHLDVDEIPHPYTEEETLNQAITRLDKEGFNIINFEEFVFLPIDQPYVSGYPGFQPICWYYFFEPNKLQLMRARKTKSGLSYIPNAKEPCAAGHGLHGERQISLECFALRHYIFRDQVHARTKYVSRSFCQAEVAVNWHRNRIGFDPEHFEFPETSTLCRLETPESRRLDRSNPKKRHYWQWHLNTNEAPPPLTSSPDRRSTNAV